MIHVDYKINDARLLVWEVTETIDELLQEIKHPDSVSDFKKIISSKRQREFLAVRVALKKLLGKEYYIFYTDAGKPFLADNCYNISVSHSGRWVVVMIHPSCFVGVDIECRNERVKKVYKRFLSEKEQINLFPDTDLEKLEIAWSAKEALYKIIGKDAVDFAAQLEIYPFEVKNEGRLKMKHVVSGNEFDLYYHQNQDYTLVYSVA